MKGGCRPLKRQSLRPIRCHESGMTLVEVLVSLVILIVVAASVAGAFAIGFRTVGTAHAQARFAGDNDLIQFEEQLGRDINRAVCLKATGQTAIPTGGCTMSAMKSGSSTCGADGTYSLCLAWYQAGSSTCHTIVYKPATGIARVARTDYNSATGTTSVVQISTDNYAITASWTPTVTSTSASGGNAAYKWTNQVTVSFAQSSASAAKPVTTPPLLSWSPLSADPLSPAIPGGSVPC